ncbi:MAG: hypothetical protein GWN00_03305 [Aliifodinibius sp.]|nr:hypothetical protein [Fodinibius sp.]NIV10247.1 hypothetical protein [Fodinibius sp.]NIY23873.1 hypothetical protein [Fodinibius sp.]
MYADNDDFIPNWARFTADYNKVFFPTGISRIYFHTGECPGCQDRLQSWRFFGDLLVDSIMRNGVIEIVSDESQLEGVIISSPELLEVLVDFHAYTLERSRHAVPYDTIKWSEVRKKYFTTHDFSKDFWFKIERRGNVDSLRDSIINILEDVDGYYQVLPPIEFTHD